MKFYSRKDPLVYIFVFVMVVFMDAVALMDHFSDVSKPSIVVYIIISASTILLLSCLFLTFYTLKNNKLSFVCGPFFGQIKLENITEIIVGKTLWVDMRPATARNGLIIKYKGGIWGEIYISPKTNESFVEEILKQNPNIKITQ